MSSPFVLPDKICCGMVVGGQDPDTVKHLTSRIEEAGFDAIWVGDHISFRIPIMESLSLLTYVASITERVRLCTGVYLVPLRHATTSAKVISTLDVLSKGRVTLGVGVGEEYVPEFEKTGIEVVERAIRTDEGIQIMRRLFSEGKVSYKGRQFEFGPIAIDSKPVQIGGPRVIVGGRKAASLRRAGQLGDGYISHMCSAEQYRGNLTLIADHAQGAGRRDAPFETTAFLFTLLDKDYDRALDRAATQFQTIYNRPFREAARKYCLLGRPEDCLEQMQRFASSGVRHFVFSPLSHHDAFIDAFQSVIQPGLSQIEL